MVGFIIKDGKIIKKVGDKKFLYDREGLVEYRNMNQYPADCEALLLINLEKSANIVIGYYGDQRIDLEIDQQCMDYIEKLAYFEEPTEEAVPGQMKVWLVQVQGVGFLCFKNISAKKIDVNVDVPSPRNLKLLPPYGAKNVLELNPGELKSVRAKVLDPQQDIGFSEKISFRQ